MKKKIIVLLSMMVVILVTGCSSNNDESSINASKITDQNSNASSIEVENSTPNDESSTNSSKITDDKSNASSIETENSAPIVSNEFDIEIVRKNINIKGHSIEVPKNLKDLSDGWTWKEHENSKYGTDGTGLAYIYYNGEEIYIAALENYFEGSENDGIIYNLTITTEDCSIDGFIPFKSTKQDVVDKYGEPNEITVNGNYNYGTTNNDDTFAGRFNEQCITFKFDENNTIIKISITYADLTKEKY